MVLVQSETFESGTRAYFVIAVVAAVAVSVVAAAVAAVGLDTKRIGSDSRITSVPSVLGVVQERTPVAGTIDYLLPFPRANCERTWMVENVVRLWIPRPL